MITPVFTSTYSIGGHSLLTLDEPEKSKPGGALSVFDLTKRGNLTQVVLEDRKIDGFLQAYKSAKAAKVQLIYGLRLTVCADAAQKDPASAKTESAISVFCRNTQGYHDLLRLWSRAATIGHYDGRARADWAMVRELWTDNLVLALPFFSSFLAVNTLTFNRVVPQLPSGIKHWVCDEVDGGGLPFSPLIRAAVQGYVKDSGGLAEVWPVKSVRYAEPGDFKALMVLRCLAEKSSFDKPEVPHLSSPLFSFAAYQELVRTAAQTPSAVLS